MTKTKQEIRRNAGGTYAGFAESEASEPRGRFGAVTKAKVTGSSEAVDYPAGASWTRDLPPDEPPLGGPPIDQVDPVGTYEELTASLETGGDERSAKPPCFASKRRRRPSPKRK